MREGDFTITRVFEPDTEAMVAALKKVQSLKAAKGPKDEESTQ